MSGNPLWDRIKPKLEEFKQRWIGRGEPADPEDFLRLLREANNENRIDAIRSHYVRAFKDRQALLDMKKQEDWADVREKVRFLIFRTALGFVIMGLILLAAYLAKRWDLPLPMMRVLP